MRTLGADSNTRTNNAARLSRILKNKIDVACVKDDTGKVQPSFDLHESVRAFGELQGELTGKVRQLDLIQTEIKRITDSKGELIVENEGLDRQVAHCQHELQRATDANAVTEKSNIRLSKDNAALEFTLARKEKELVVLKVNGRRLKEDVSHLETSVQEQSPKAVDSSYPDAESVVAKLISEVAKAKAKNASQQEALSRKIDEMTRAHDEKVVKYNSRIGTLHAEVLRLQSRPERLAEARAKEDASSSPSPKREVSVVSSARSVSPGTNNLILVALARMDQRISGLSNRIDVSERASSSRPSSGPVRGRSTTRRVAEHRGSSWRGR